MKTIRFLSLLAFAAISFALSAADGPTPLVTRKQDQLIQVLKSDAGEKEKADACRELTVVGTAEAVPALVALLNHDHLAHMARYALESIPDPAVEAALREQLGKLQGRRLAGVATSLGVRRDVNALTALGKLLADSDSNVVQAAAYALGRIGTPEAAELLIGSVTDPADPNLGAVADALARCGDRLAAAGQRDLALSIFDHYTETQLPHQIRVAAFRGAVLTRGTEGYALMRDQLRGDDAVLFNTAIRLSYEIKDNALTGLLAAELPKQNTDRKIVIMQAIGRRGDVAGLPALLKEASAGDPGLRATALRAAAEIQSPTAIPAYVDLLMAPSRDVSQAAIEALAATPGPEANAAVVKLFADATKERRLIGIDLIGRRRMLSAVPDLMKAAQDANPQVRRAAAKQLGDLCVPSQLGDLLNLLTNSSDARDLEDLESAVAAVAGRAPAIEEVSAQVVAKLASAKPEPKATLIRVLTSLGGANALKAVRAAVKDSSEDVRDAAIRSLGAWRTTEAAPDLLDQARSASDDKTRLLCLRSYLGMAANGDLPAGDRLTMCRQGAELIKRDDEKKLLLAALGSIPSVDALSLALPHLESGAKGETVAAVLSIVPRVLQDNQAAKTHGAKLVEALQKITPAATNPDQEQRARTLLKQAQDKMAK